MEKEQQPEVKPGDWIVVNKGTMHPWAAVVCSFDTTHPGWVEVVYLEKVRPPRRKRPRRPRALQTYVVWKEGRWQRAYDDPNEGYADNYSPLAEFVGILRRGR